MTLQEQLDDARAKYHQLVTGKSTVSIQENGRSRSFHPADAGKLLSYIASLESQLGAKTTGRGRPMRVC